MRSDKFGSQLLNVYVSWIERGKILISQLSLPKFRYFTDQNGRKGEPQLKWIDIFDIFQIQKWISQIVRAQKIDDKNGVICLVSLFPSLVKVLKLPKIVHFFQICADLSRNLNLLKQFIYIHLKDLMLFQKTVFFIGDWAAVHEILRNKVSKKCWISKNLAKFTIFKR